MIAVLLAALSGGLLILAFPAPDLGWLAFVALVPLLWAIRGQTPVRAFYLGTLAGLLFYLISVSWVTHSMTAYGGVPFALSALALIVLAAYLSLYLGVFAMGASWMASVPWPLNLLAPSALWVGLEYLRTYALTGFPWILLGYTQYRNSWLLPAASVAGVYGLSFLVVLTNTALTQVVGGAPGRLRTIGVTGAVALTLVWSPRLLLPPSAPVGSEQALGVALVQGNIDQGLKWDPAMQAATIEQYRRLSLEAAKDAPALIVWPETAVPFFLRYEPALLGRVLDVATETGSYLLVGSPDAEPPAAADGGTRYRNSAFLISPQRELLNRYDKIHMVPFGEYVPLKSLLFFINKLAYGIGDFEAGQTYTVFDTPGGRFSATICYEAIFPDQVRRYVKDGAEFLVNITNDAWFGRSAAPAQHLAMAVLRAVENRRYLVRAANTGISAIVDPSGRILHASDLFMPAVITDQIRVERTQTFYTRYGDLFAWICIIFIMVAVFMTTWVRGAVRIASVPAATSQRRMR
ncbi:MAG: apolipoprotein N-acyltransferase [candidate division NC10 bacterium]|nr:apolipoprotein N-acyltransferase [candidate division NC10 bacterium]